MNGWASRGVVTTGLAVALGLAPCDGVAQVFLATRPHPEFAIGPLLVVAGVRPGSGAGLGAGLLRADPPAERPSRGHAAGPRISSGRPRSPTASASGAARSGAPRVRGAARLRGGDRGAARARRARPGQARHPGAERSVARVGAVRDLLQGGDESRAGGGGDAGQVRVDAPPRRPERPSERLGAPQGSHHPEARDLARGALLGPPPHPEPERGQRRIPGALLDPPRSARPRDPARPGLLDPRRRVRRFRSPPHRGDQLLRRRPAGRAGCEPERRRWGSRSAPARGWCPRC